MRFFGRCPQNDNQIFGRFLADFWQILKYFLGALVSWWLKIIDPPHHSLTKKERATKAALSEFISSNKD